jgi:PKD repeat protein
VATGVKSVTLLVRGPAGSHQRLMSNIIKVDPPLAPHAGFQAAPLIGMAPLDAQFGDASTGLVTSRTWDFGDGTTDTSTSPHHVYAASGRYTVSLRVQNQTGADTLTRTEYVRVTDVPAPAADFVLDVASGISPLDVQFQDASQGDVTAWRWDFGDGATSTARDPLHTYFQSGTFTVTLTATGPGGPDDEAKPGLVTVAMPPPPEAAFAADVTIDPLTVGFTDLSSGVVTSRSWSFGDGATGGGTNPVHTYVAAGTYSVSLLATGPGGSDAAVEIGLVSVHSVERGLADPSFEEQTPGVPPSRPWKVLAGSEHVVQPAGPVVTDGSFPSEGAQWLQLSSAGTSFSTPPTNPGGVSGPPFGGAGIAQDFYLADPLSVLAFDAAFVRGDAQRDDWMSVDVTDDVTTVNLFFANRLSPAPELSLPLGLPRTAAKRVRADLRALFPSSVRNTSFRLTIQVGNDGSDLDPSYALVDGVRLEQALGTALRYGCDAAVRGSLSVLSGAPRLGTTLTLGVDNPLGTQGPNSRAYAWMSLKPSASYPCGTLLANFGMAGAGAPGEVLVDRTAGVLIKTVTGGLWSKPGVPAAVALVMPSAIGWIGSPLYVQGYLVDGRVTYGVRTGVTDALKLLMGP